MTIFERRILLKKTIVFLQLFYDISSIVTSELYSILTNDRILKQWN
jgi:hypothetical protein